MPLHRADRVQRPARFVVLADEVNGMHLGIVRIYSRFPVAYYGVRLPGVPELADEIDVFGRHRIPLVMLVELVHAEVLRGPVLTGCDDIPAEPARRDVIDRGAEPGQQERWVEAGRHGRYHAELRRGL